MRAFSLREYESVEDVDLADPERSALLALAPYISLRAGGRSATSFALEAGGYVGAARLGDLSIQVRPKIPLDRVLFLISYAIDPKTWRELQHSFSDADTILDAVAWGFAGQLRRALSRGLLHGYRVTEESGTTVRGRIRVDDQIRARFGRIPPVEVRFDDFTADTPENQILKAALRRLRRSPLRSPETRKLLDHFAPRFDAVADVWIDPRSIPRFSYTRLNQHYRPALELARIILRGSGWELRGGSTAASAFFIDMAWVFEEFLGAALTDALESVAGELRRGDRSFSLDGAGAVQLKPDFSWWEGETCWFIGDAKYKRLAVPGVIHSDLYQLLAYTTAAELGRGLLVYADGECEAVTHVVPFANKVLEIESIRLSGNPEDILAEVGRIAGRILDQVQLHREAAGISGYDGAVAPTLGACRR